MDRAEVKTAIKRLEVSGARVTVRAVRGELGRGSLQDITAHLKAIRAESVEPASSAREVPDAIPAGSPGDNSAVVLLRRLSAADTPEAVVGVLHGFGLADDPASPSDLADLPADPLARLAILEVRYAVALAKAGNELRLRRETQADMARLRARLAELEGKITRLRTQPRSTPTHALTEWTAPKFSVSIRRHFASDVKGRIDPAAVTALGDVVVAVIGEHGDMTIAELRQKVPQLRRTRPSRLLTMLARLREQGRIGPGIQLISLP